MARDDSTGKTRLRMATESMADDTIDPLQRENYTRPSITSYL